jgi:hypothetical protein
MSEMPPETQPGSPQMPSTLAQVLNEPAPPLRTRTIFALVVSLVALLTLPTLGYVIAKTYLASFFSSIWGSPYDACGRLWLFASFLTTALITNIVVTEIVGSAKYDGVRHDPNFVKCANYIRHLPTVALIVGLVLTFFTPARFDPIFYLKLMALAVAALMFVLDFLILSVVRATDDSLRKEFSTTLWYVDLPTFSAILLVILIFFIYKLVLPASDIAALKHSDNEIFLMGLSSGAVAVELYFANLLFFLVFRDDSSIA